MLNTLHHTCLCGLPYFPWKANLELLWQPTKKRQTVFSTKILFNSNILEKHFSLLSWTWFSYVTLGFSKYFAEFLYKFYVCLNKARFFNETNFRKPSILVQDSIFLTKNQTWNKNITHTKEKLVHGHISSYSHNWGLELVWTHTDYLLNLFIFTIELRKSMQILRATDGRKTRKKLPSLHLQKQCTWT